MEPALTVEQLAVAGPPGAAFTSLSFRVMAGEGVGLTALGAMDLTRLLDVLAGLEPPAEGEVAWGALSSKTLQKAGPGRERYHVERKVRLEVGYLSATGSLLQNMSLEENIALPLCYHTPFSAKEVTDRVGRLTEMLGIAAEAGLRPAALAPGVLRRGELARALILKPKVLILDAASSGLDRESFRVLGEALKEYRAGGMAVLAAAQDPLELAAMCSRVLVLDRGRLAGSLAEKDLLDRALLSDSEALLKKLERSATDAHPHQPD